MSEKVLVIVESPTKARTIKRFLPKDYMVEASIGHVRDLPQTAADVPKKYKGLPWARLGIDIENDFSPLYVLQRGKSKIINELKRKLKEADALYLATDEDREGESISWHLIELLKPKTPIYRMVFHEITKTAIQEALKNPRQINMNMVKAQEARRILDRLYGFTLSPLIWKKIAYGLSAGRVQSPGLRLIVERERERIIFKKAVYWDLKASLSDMDDDSTENFEAKLIQFKNKKVASGKDFDSLTGSLLKPENTLVLTEEESKDLKKSVESGTWKVLDITEKETQSRPSIPFITSTLQQEGNRKLGLSARETMRAAQRLYEEGLITYMRTDSPTLSQEGINGARKAVEDLYGKEYLSKEPRQYSTKSQSAQEAHEAIRPASGDFKHPDDIGLSGKEKALYELIWKRTLAAQMAEAKKSSMSVKIEVDEAVFQANGTRIIFPGYLRVYVEGKDDPDAAMEDKEVILPELQKDQQVYAQSVEALYHETKPPARFTEASLIQRLEREGIGRPSTYSSIISTLYERSYVRKVASALVPTFTGVGVIQFLERNFEHLINYGFTSSMESSLDKIAQGQEDRSEYLDSFYNGKKGIKQEVEQKEEKISPDESRTIVLPQLNDSTDIRIGRYGPYIIAKDEESGEKIHASIPEEYAPADLMEQDITELIEIQKRGPEPIGIDPETKESIYCLVGRFGPYVQKGEVTEENPKPKRAGIPKGTNPREVTLEEALKYLSLPRVLGQHPDTGKDIAVNVGRFGPFVVHDGDFRSLKPEDDVYSVGFDRAMEILSEEKKGRRGSTLVRDFGTDEKNKKIAIYNGKYGLYIKLGTKNISLPEDKKNEEAVQKLSLEEVKEIIKNNTK